MRLLLILLVGILIGCDSINESNDESESLVNFSQLEAGQKSRYISFEGGSIYDPGNATFKYLSDTLTLEVLGKADDGYILLERVLPGPESLRQWEDSVMYRVDIKDDSLFISSIGDTRTYSNLFLAQNQPLPLAPIQENQAELDGVVLSSTQDGLEQSGYILNHTQQNVYYARLNFLQDASAITYDGPAYTVVYSQDDGIVRTFYLSAWTGNGFGWDLMP